MIDNQDIAVFTRLNDLAERYGLKPYDFVATFRPVEQAAETWYELRFESHVAGNPQWEAKFDQMLASIGIPRDDPTATLAGQPSDIIDGLDTALSQAPARAAGFKTAGGGRGRPA